MKLDSVLEVLLFNLFSHVFWNMNFEPISSRNMNNTHSESQLAFKKTKHEVLPRRCTLTLICRAQRVIDANGGYIEG